MMCATNGYYRTEMKLPSIDAKAPSPAPRPPEPQLEDVT